MLAADQVLPDPEASELCVYFGTVAGGRWGGFLAGLGFLLPGFILMLLYLVKSRFTVAFLILGTGLAGLFGHMVLFS